MFATRDSMSARWLSVRCRRCRFVLMTNAKRFFYVGYDVGLNKERHKL